MSLVPAREYNYIRRYCGNNVSQHAGHIWLKDFFYPRGQLLLYQRGTFLSSLDVLSDCLKVVCDLTWIVLYCTHKRHFAHPLHQPSVRTQYLPFRTSCFEVG